MEYNTIVGVFVLQAVGAESNPDPVEFGTPGIALQPYVVDHRRGASGSLVNLSFLLAAPAGRDGFLRIHDGHIAKPSGRFDAGANVFRTANPDLHFRLESNGGEYSQTAVMKTSPTEVLTRTERMDVVIGSGRKGQTYLYWDGDHDAALLLALNPGAYTVVISGVGDAEGVALMEVYLVAP